jgi:cellulose biosynthesis protein BcsQ
MTPEKFRDYSRQNDQEVQELNQKISEHILEGKLRDGVMLREMEELKEKVEALTKSVTALLDLWQQAKGIVTFMKWVSAIGGGVVAFFVFIKDHIK